MAQEPQHPKCIQYQASHDGKIYAWWEAQREWNKEMDAKVYAFGVRLTALEKKVILMSGVAAGAGSGIGAWITSLLS